MGVHLPERSDDGTFDKRISQISTLLLVLVLFVDKVLVQDASLSVDFVWG